MLLRELDEDYVAEQHLQIECSNGHESDTCSIKIEVVKFDDAKPKWLIPPEGLYLVVEEVNL